ncbi:AraC family transcriptional regulator [Zhouia amylolytica AD3]|uniref:AraC family transcriptional regulator n=1 Tax=Zhouia amylolytica AD3 TaxID=1286632 RepID=W2USY6_9FLAO|nr:AraC family transcriptional regulator [Zhouia amylolytica AD3]
MNDYRVQEVKILLNNSNHLNESVIQIAYSVGFSNRVSFNKAFKKRTGMTPTEYINGVKRGFNS